MFACIFVDIYYGVWRSHMGNAYSVVYVGLVNEDVEHLQSMDASFMRWEMKV